jgi:hypothetical protein
LVQCKPFIYIATLEKQNYAVRPHDERERARVDNDSTHCTEGGGCLSESHFIAHGGHADIFIARVQRGKEEKLFLPAVRSGAM